MEKSGFRLFSRNAISIRGGATTVLFRVWARVFPFSPLMRIFSLRACASPRLEHEPISKYFCCLGRPRLHVQRFHLQVRQIAGAALQRPAQGYRASGKTPRYISIAYQTTLRSPPACRRRSISCFSNWWMRYTPRSSMPCAPFSLRKHGE